MPKRPPDTNTVLSELAGQIDAGRIFEWLLRGVGGPTVRGEYLHWDKLKRRKAPAGYTTEQWWAAIKLHRFGQYQQIPLTDPKGQRFRYVLLNEIHERLHQIDLHRGGIVQMPAPITNPHTRDRYSVNSLIEEAITSSQIEGATTTRQVAKEMIRSNRPPRDVDEQMILNNYRAMKQIGDYKNQELTKEMVLAIHATMTKDTLRNSSAVGRFRNDDERIEVVNEYGDVLHSPPPAGELDARMRRMCEFANNQAATPFVHPVIQSMILHFWLAYDHPFVDGNGRTARVLFYWSMLRHDYWIFEFVSISHFIRKSPAQYGMSFLYAETDDNDLTYFLLYHLDVIEKSMQALHEYIRRKSSQVNQLEKQLRGMTFLNHRQLALISHALRHPGQIYTIASHQKSHAVVYQTARQDLLDLERRGLLHGKKLHKQWHFTPAADIEDRLAQINPLELDSDAP